MPEASNASTSKVVCLPRTRRLSWTAMVLEAVHQFVLALWTGALAFAASLMVPTLLAELPDPDAASRVALDLLSRLGILGCGAGSLLLLTTLLMHLLALRDLRTIAGQTLLVLFMTALAVLLQVRFAPSLTTLLRRGPELFQSAQATTELARFRSLFGIYLGLMLAQALSGLALMLAGVRRWYRYVPTRGDRADIFWP